MAVGVPHTSMDYAEAAFVFQHGDSPQDYLSAHRLAILAVSKGDPTVVGIATATLNRHLQSMDLKQVFGTQYLRDGTGN